METDRDAAGWYRAWRALRGSGPWDVQRILDVTDKEHLAQIAASRGWRMDNPNFISMLQLNSPFFSPKRGTFTIQHIDFRS